MKSRGLLSSLSFILNVYFVVEMQLPAVDRYRSAINWGSAQNPINVKVMGSKLLLLNVMRFFANLEVIAKTRISFSNEFKHFQPFMSKSVINAISSTMIAALDGHLFQPNFAINADASIIQKSATIEPEETK